jgi:hypothetical protein
VVYQTRARPRFVGILLFLVLDAVGIRPMFGILISAFNMMQGLLR